MKNKTSKPQLTLEAIMSALHPLDVSLAQDSDLIAGAGKALERGITDAEAALDFALAWRSGFRDGQAALGYQSAEAEQEPTVDAEAIRQAERERIKAVIDGAPAEKQAAAMALAFGSDLPAEKVLEVLLGLPMPTAKQAHRAITGLRAKDSPAGLVGYDAETGETIPLAQPVGYMPHDPLAGLGASNPSGAAWKATIEKINAEQK